MYVLHIDNVIFWRYIFWLYYLIFFMHVFMGYAYIVMLPFGRNCVSVLGLVGVLVLLFVLVSDVLDTLFERKLP